MNSNVKLRRKGSNFTAIIVALVIFLIVFSVVAVVRPTPIHRPTTNHGNLISVTDGNWWTDADWLNAPIRTDTIDYTNTYNGNPSWRIPLTSVDWGVDHGGITISPSNVIVYTCWIKTSAATLAADVGNLLAGGRIGIDIYGANGASFGISDPKGLGTTTWKSNTFVQFGTNTWTQISITFTVASQYAANQVTHGQKLGTVFTPTWCTPWIQTYSSTQYCAEGGTAWFSNPQFHINPSTSIAIPSPL